jgi:hypothetical protein
LCLSEKQDLLPENTRGVPAYRKKGHCKRGVQNDPKEKNYLRKNPKRGFSILWISGKVIC